MIVLYNKSNDRTRKKEGGKKKRKKILLHTLCGYNMINSEKGGKKKVGFLSHKEP